MTSPDMTSLGSADIIAFVPTRNPEKARAFYQETLGLDLVSEDAFAAVFDAHGTTLRVVNVAAVSGYEPAPFTILGWQVPDAEKVVSELTEKGVAFERFPGMEHDKLGIWKSPGSARVAWFKDPDGNVLSITQV